MTAQEILNKVVAHMREQGRQSNTAGPGSSCRYRSPDGARCAVGCLIPDDIYNPGIEGRSVNSAAVQMLLMDLGLQQHKSLLISLQGAHDWAWGSHEEDGDTDFKPVPPWMQIFEHRARGLAKRYGLEYPA